VAAVNAFSVLLMLQPLIMAEAFATSADSQIRQAAAPEPFALRSIASLVLFTNKSMVALQASKKVILTPGMLVLQLSLTLDSQLAMLS